MAINPVDVRFAICYYKPVKHELVNLTHYLRAERGKL